jgi:hypothetical protein
MKLIASIKLARRYAMLAKRLIPFGTLIALMILLTGSLFQDSLRRLKYAYKQAARNRRPACLATKTNTSSMTPANGTASASELKIARVVMEAIPGHFRRMKHMQAWSLTPHAMMAKYAFSVTRKMHRLISKRSMRSQASNW